MIRRISYWLLAVAGSAVLSYLYNPNLPTMLASGLIVLVLTFLVAWSAPRVGRGMRAGILLMAVSIVLGFMFSQALDVAYSLLSAPAGLRFNVVLETAVATTVFLVFGLLARVLVPRPKVEE